MNPRLPIETYVPDIIRAMAEHGKAVVSAEPGAGKTTLLPLRLLEAGVLDGKSMIMLEPRRLAARMAASRMADMLGEPVGKTVGYHIRNDRVMSSETRIQVLTEGILTRRIQSDPTLKDIGLVIFDEFHERNLVSDLGLALCLEITEALRDDLGILIMSATIDSGPISELMGHAPVITCPGRQFPVETRYIKQRPGVSYSLFSEQLCVSSITEALAAEQGDILVFLPGVGEIKRVHGLLEQKVNDPSVRIFPLYGNLTKQEQDAAVRPSGKGGRKIVLATSIAETSLTIEGVRVVIDSGWMRIPRFYSGTGMSRLETQPVSKAGADQRRGRAGRLEKGVCYRLWPAEDMGLRPEFTPAEILNADLCALMLELALWGVREPSDLKWLDPPPKSACDQARNLLTGLKALTHDGSITAHGKTLAGLGIHPRLGHMIVFGRDKGMGYLACVIAALLQEKDPLHTHGGQSDSDIRARIDFVVARHNRQHGRTAPILDHARTLAQRMGITPGAVRADDAGRLLAQAYPDRIALKREGPFGSYKMASGMAAFVNEADSMGHYGMIACADTDGRRSNAKIYLAAPFDPSWLETDFKSEIHEGVHVFWDGNGIASVLRRSFGKLVLSETPVACDDEEKVTAIMLQVIRSRGMDVLPWTKHLRSIQSRTVFLKDAGGFDDLPDLSDQALSENLENWLAPFLPGIRSMKHLAAMDLASALLSQLTWEQRQVLETQAPTHLTVPSGSRIPLDYTASGTSPVLSVRIQEMFGLSETPKIAGGRVPVTIHLLSPAGRPAQVTQDLESFWKNRYDQVKKELRGRYPRHYWPDDPLQARATNKSKKKMDAQ